MPTPPFCGLLNNSGGHSDPEPTPRGVKVRGLSLTILLILLGTPAVWAGSPTVLSVSTPLELESSALEDVTHWVTNFTSVYTEELWDYARKEPMAATALRETDLSFRGGQEEYYKDLARDVLQTVVRERLDQIPLWMTLQPFTHQFRLPRLHMTESRVRLSRQSLLDYTTVSRQDLSSASDFISVQTGMGLITSDRLGLRVQARLAELDSLWGYDFIQGEYWSFQVLWNF